MTFWIGSGAGVWAMATAALSVLAGPLFASGALVYSISTIGICIGFVLLFLGLGRWSGTVRADYLPAAGLFSAPGLLGEVPVMLMFPVFVPSMPSDGVRAYAAFLFLGYAALLAVAATVSMWDPLGD